MRTRKTDELIETLKCDGCGAGYTYRTGGNIMFCDKCKIRKLQLDMKKANKILANIKSFGFIGKQKESR